MTTERRKYECAVRGRIQAGVRCGFIIVGEMKHCGYDGQCQHQRPEPAPDPISLIADRDTPPDNRRDVIDCHVDGSPITRGDVAAFKKELP